MSRVRIGVDVGGTFTKAVAVELPAGRIVAQAVLPTSHDAANGVAEGIVDAVTQVADAVGPEHVELVTHSTTQTVNALLEGDVEPVGVIGLGRHPDVKQARRRTTVADIDLAPGHRLATDAAFVDVTDGLPVDQIDTILDGFGSRSIHTVCVAEAFAPDDDRNETAVADLAERRGHQVCTSTELSGLYGLELRTVTAAINASILPIAARTAQFVSDGVAKAGLGAPLMVMRGDGGSTDLTGFREAPVRTLYSGPAASVTGALRATGIVDGIVLEVGGTSTNVAAVRRSLPLLNYVKVASHATAVRAVDVQVVGVAGGSMVRLGRRHARAVGPRSAHIAGLSYVCFLEPVRLEGAEIELIAPRPGDPADHVVVRLADRTAAALTVTCAANALGVVQPGDYAAGSGDAARRAFELAGRRCGLAGDRLAAEVLAAAGEAVCDVVWELVHRQRLRSPRLIAVGGGAGALGRHVAEMLHLPIDIPAGAEVISSIGDALAHVRTEHERTVTALDAATVRAMVAQVESEARRAGAAEETIEVRVEEHPERATIRAIATGALELDADDGRPVADQTSITAARPGADVASRGSFWIARSGAEITVLDRYGEPIVRLKGEAVGVDDLAATYQRLIRYRGPVTLRPTVVHVTGNRVCELSSPDAAAVAEALHVTCGDETYLVGRPT